MTRSLYLRTQTQLGKVNQDFRVDLHGANYALESKSALQKATDFLHAQNVVSLEQTNLQPQQ